MSELKDLNEMMAERTKESKYSCAGCKRSFPTDRVLNQHLRFCLLKTGPKENLVPSSQPVLENEIITIRSSASCQFQWGDISCGYDEKWKCEWSLKAPHE